jgi:hypothetical protein
MNASWVRGKRYLRISSVCSMRFPEVTAWSHILTAGLLHAIRLSEVKVIIF